jgi:hypothetical protein
MEQKIDNISHESFTTSHQQRQSCSDVFKQPKQQPTQNQTKPSHAAIGACLQDPMQAVVIG